MPVCFSTILIPVDFSPNTGLSVTKALELSGGRNTIIHLYHVQQPRISGIFASVRGLIVGHSRRDVNNWVEESETKLSKLKEHIERLRPDIQVIAQVVFETSIEESIIIKAQRLRPDLIIIGKTSHHYLFPFLNTIVPCRLARASGTPVLMAKHGSLFNGIKTVVVPVGKQFPSRKMEVMEALSKKLKLHVRLVMFAIDEHDTDFSRQSIIYTFSLLKSSLALPVDFEVLRGNNRAKALLKYCNKINADMLIVHPESETRLNGWIARHISDLLPADSKTQVLSVQPA